jgi:hypothetical protein
MRYSPLPTPTRGFDYAGFYEEQLDKKKADNSYRYFNNINRLAKEFPLAHTAKPGMHTCLLITQRLSRYGMV